MKITINEYYEDRTGEYITTKYLVDEEQITEEEYHNLMDTLDEINEFAEDECDGNCDECLNNQIEQPLEANQFLIAVTNAVNDVLEMFEDENTCDDCKAHALMELVMLGVDGALQGCIGKSKLDLN